jgi:hypothetical protein
VLKIENSDDDYSNSNSNFSNEDVDEYYQVPHDNNSLAESDQ